MKNSINQNIWHYAVEAARKSLKFTCDGETYKFMKIIFYIALAYTFVVNLAVIFGQILNIEDLSEIVEPTSAQLINLMSAKNLLALATVTIVLYVIGIFLLSKKRPTAFLSINVLSSISLFVSFRMSMASSILSDGTLKFWVRHGIPLTMLVVVSVLLFLICFFEQCKRKIEYNRLMDCLYINFSKKDENVVKNSDFEEYLNSYNGFEIKANMDKPLKKSEKIRKRKQEAENKRI